MKRNFIVILYSISFILCSVRTAHAAMVPSSSTQILKALGSSRSSFVTPVPNISKGLLNWWTFDGNSYDGTTATDRGSLGVNLTEGGTVNSTTGVLGSGVAFANSISNFLSKSSFSTAPYGRKGTIAFWVKIAGVDTNDEAMPITISQSGQSYSNEFFIAFHNYTTGCNEAANVNTIYVKLTSGGANPAKWLICASTNASNAAIGKWAHITITQDGTSPRLYINGRLESITFYSGQNTDVTAWFGDIGSADTFSLNTMLRTTRDFPLNGDLDDVRIYNRALSPVEINQIYKLDFGKHTVNSSQTNLLKASTTVKTNGLVGWWTFDGRDTIKGQTCISGLCTRYIDRSGQGNTGTSSPALVSSVGKIGQGLSFNATDSRVTVKNSAIIFRTTQGTVCAWTKNNSYGRNAIIYTENISGGSVFGANRESTNKYRFAIHSGANGWKVAEGTTVPVLRRWYHYCGTFNNVEATNYIRVYVNGKLEGTDNTWDGNFNTNSIVGSLIGDAYNDANISFDGILDDVRIYNRELSAAEIYQLYQLGGAKIEVNSSQTNLQKASTTVKTNGLVGWWTFDGKDCGTTYCLDKSGNGNTGTRVGTSAVAGKIGQALKFRTGSSDSVSLGKTILNGLGDFSVSFWVFPQSTPSNNFRLMVQCGDYGTSCDANNMFSVNFDSLNRLVAELSPGGVYKATDATEPVGLRKWSMYTLTRSGDTVTQYINGASPVVTTGFNTGTLTSSLNFLLTTAEGSSVNFNGLLDDARVYNRALTADEVRMLYNLGK